MKMNCLDSLGKNKMDTYGCTKCQKDTKPASFLYYWLEICVKNIIFSANKEKE